MLSISCTAASAGLNVSGVLGPALPGESISITYTAPTGSVVTHSATTGDDGSYADSLHVLTRGTWHVQAHWDGNDQYLPADSSTCSVAVFPPG
jgi:hypothetical protein